MGLAASQARFLCITARKADCEYRSTELAQQKLDITKQISDISTQYAQAMNATKLIWSNEAVENDFGLTYSLLMMPSAANDYNPYMVTSPSGAIVLNSEYAAAAKAAGISKAGGVGSQVSRDKFISALAYGGIVTEETAKAITVYDYEVSGKDAVTGKLEFNDVENPSISSISWNPAAGMGSEPLDKSSVNAMTLEDLCLSETMGKQLVDWAKILLDGENQITSLEYSREEERLNDLLSKVSGFGTKKVDDDVVNQLKADYRNQKNSVVNPLADPETLRLESLVDQAQHIYDVDQRDIDGDDKLETVLINPATNNPILDHNKQPVTQDAAFEAIKAQLQADLDAHKALKSTINVESIQGEFNTSVNSLKGTNQLDDDGTTQITSTYSVVQNGVINHYQAELQEMTIGDILTGNIVLMANNNLAGTSSEERLETFVSNVTKLLDSMVAIFGYSETKDLSGQGLNVDDASSSALSFAYNMVKKTFLSLNDAVGTGSRTNNKSMVDNSAYLNAENYNRVGYMTDGAEYYGVSLTNMLRSFLTYYENALSGANSDYVVGKGVDSTIYVTDNLSYVYIGQAEEDAVTDMEAKSADFFDQLYNNILEYGWREDAATDDYEYLEAALKDGRYSMSSLNQDGYYYQTRYNETGYMVEVSDTDAIERAEAEFSSKKAELTYKEDSIDLKTKKLDAEISSLSTEYDTVKNLISKSIEKTFALFSN